MTPSEECLAFYFEIGLATTQWAQLERSLLDVAGACTNKRDFNALGHAFFAIENFRSKLAFVTRLVEIKFEKKATYLAAWAKLEDKIKKASGRRNKLVHNRQMGFMLNPVGKRFILLPWIVPSELKKKTNTKTASRHFFPPEAMGVLEIALHRSEAHGLVLEVDNFAAKLDRRKKPFSASVVQQLNPRPTLSNLVAQLPAYNERQPPPSRP